MHLFIIFFAVKYKKADLREEIMSTKTEIAVKKYRDFYNMKPNSPIIMKEFWGFYGRPIWEKQGYVKPTDKLEELFDFDESGVSLIEVLGDTEPPFIPQFKVEVLEDQEKYEIVRDVAGRHVKYFKGRRNGFMPEYIDHPVKDMKSWEENVKWRLDPENPEHKKRFDNIAPRIKKDQAAGKLVSELMLGGYMYLRSIIGPEDLLFSFYDDPELIHECMKAWLDYNDKMIAYHQQSVNIDELFLDEDICYNHASLISHDMIREFLFPYYQQLINNVKSRMPDESKKLHIQLATDGACHTVIDLYKEIGVDFMSPFEVASGCDVVEIGRKHPDLLISGGIDKRILASTKEDIDRELDRIMPVMYKRGGYIPTCDHSVPEEVSFENYLHFRNRLKEYAN